MKVGVAPIGIAVGEEVALLGFLPFVRIPNRFQPRSSSIGQVAAEHLR